MTNAMESPELVYGLGRSYFNRRLASGLRELMEKRLDEVEYAQSDEVAEALIKVDIAAALQQLYACPVCQKELVTHDTEPFFRSCKTCGEFTITSVLSNGEVIFTFQMFPTENSTYITEA